MNIRMKVMLAGNGYTLKPGDERDFPEAEAIRIIEAGYAIPASTKKIERAVAEPTPEVRGASGKEGDSNVVSGVRDSATNKRTGKRRGRQGTNKYTS